MSISTNSQITPRYRLAAPLGQGSMGAVYRAQDRLSGQDVALKCVTLDADDADELRLALAHEFRTLAGLRHPHIISVLDYGFTADRQPFFTMELLDNTEPILEAGRDLPVDARIDLLIQALEALAYLHRRGILHHDLKPANMLVADGRLHLLDFGLAVLAAQPRADDTFGTLQYLAPEVIAGQPYSEASDLYSLGVIAYELLVGRHPIAAQTARSFLQELRHTPPDLSPLAAQPALATVVGYLLAKAPAARPPSAQATIRAFLQALGLPDTQPDTAIRESYLQAATFVGRAPELAQLSAALEQARQGQGAAFLIGGESGVGKSRLLDELRTRALVEGFHVLRGQAVEGGGLPYQLWREPLRQLVLSSALSDSEAGILKEIVPDIAVLLERPIADVPSLPGADGQQRLAFVLVALIRRQREPLLLLAEDLQWASESLVLLRALQKELSTLPLCVVGNYRSDERPTLPQELAGDLQLLPLQRLEAAQIAQLSGSILGAAGAAPELVELLQHETEGNVFFLVETVRALAEEAGDLERIGRMTLPRSVLTGGVQQVVRRRLARVPAWGQPLLQLAAVAGRVLDELVLQASRPTIMLGEWLRACADVAVLELVDDRWRFTHDKLREALLTDLPASQRAQLHRQVAEAIEATYPGDNARAELLLDHWRQAGDSHKELVYTLNVAELLIQIRASYRPAITLIERGLELVALHPEARAEQIELHTQLGRALRLAGDLPRALSTLERGLRLATLPEHAYLHARLLDHLGLAQMYADQFAQALANQRAALQMYREQHHRIEEADSLNILGLVYGRMGDYARARTHHAEALAMAQALGNKRVIKRTANNVGLAAFNLRDFADAEQHLRLALAINREVSDRNGISICLFNLARLEVEQGNPARALADLTEGASLTREIGEPIRLLETCTALGTVQLDLGDLPAAQQALQEALAAAQQVQTRQELLDLVVACARLAYAQGQQARAAGLASFADAQAVLSPATRRQQLQPLLEQLYEQILAPELAALREHGSQQTLQVVLADLWSPLSAT